MKRRLAIGLLTLIAGCGVDGEPVRPQAAGTLTFASSGAHVGGVVGIDRGPFTLLWGF